MWQYWKMLVCPVRNSNIFYNENKSLRSVDAAVVRFPNAGIVINWLSEVEGT